MLFCDPLAHEVLFAVMQRKYLHSIRVVLSIYLKFFVCTFFDSDSPDQKFEFLRSH